MLDWRATWCELEPPPWLALLPLGSIEQHGPHLPIGTDWYIAGYLAEGIARELEAWLLPAQPFSCCQEHQGFPGTISLRPATLTALLTDLTESVGRCGVPRLAVLNYHGGNWALKAAVRDLNRHQSKVTVLAINMYEGALSETMAEDLHAGAFETSQWLHLAPELVREVTGDFVPETPPTRLDQVGIRAISPQGFWGRPTRASAERGARDLAWMITDVARQVRDSFAEVERLRGG